MSKILLKLSYVGTAYHGWQVQKNAKSVQKTVQNALCELCGSDITLTGCSRTDTGVHARCYFALAEGDIPKGLLSARMPNALNVNLPPDICAKGAYFVDDGFHPRYSVTAKEYEYVIIDQKYPDPFLFGRAWKSSKPLDVALMNKCAKDFIGKHDFTAFCAAGSKAMENGDCVRTVFDARVERVGENVSFRVCADGFLYNMVRIMAGTLVDISLGKIGEGDIPKIIESKNRNMAGRTLPPDGLYLDRVEYTKGALIDIE